MLSLSHLKWKHIKAEILDEKKAEHADRVKKKVKKLKEKIREVITLEGKIFTYNI